MQELTILMPCLNEEETLGICIDKAMAFLKNNHIQGEVLIADNGSTDNSIKIAEEHGARVIHVPLKGYGHALIAGTNAALGKYIIMGDADDSYDFLNLMPFVAKLREGYDLVMGDRFAGGIEKGAMPWLHKYIGNPVLSYIGRLFFRSEIKDFHCGLRGYNTEMMRKLNLQTGGMEYASEMVVMSELNHLKIAQVPTTLKKDGRNRAPHLRSFRDGWRHLKFLLMFAPDWLFLFPGIVIFLLGLLGLLSLEVVGSMTLHNVSFGVHTLLYCAFLTMIGVKIIFLYVFTKVYAVNHKFILETDRLAMLEKITVDRGVLVGAILATLGFILSISAVLLWAKTGFSTLNPEQIMRFTIPGATTIAIGLDFIFSSFFIGLLRIK